MIVLAGGIGAGKSVVARILRLRGFGVFDCDIEARKLMEEDEDLVKSLKTLAGEDIYRSGKLDRKHLGQLLFSDGELRKKVNSLVHGRIRERIREWLAADKANIFVETAIASQSGIAAEAEAIWLVEASDATKMERVALRDGRSEEDIIKIMEAQEREDKDLQCLSIPMERISNNPDDQLLDRINELLKNFL